jgi:putative ABC transport system permease protein
MDALRQDLRHAVRVLRKSPAFTLAAVATLGLGIAANTAIFGFMNALLLRPFPLLEADRLVSVWERHPEEGSPGGHDAAAARRNPLAPADYRALAAASPGIARIAAYRFRDFIVTETGEPERVPGFHVTPGYFETIGVRPALGRTFLDQEGDPGRDAVAVVSHGFWQRRFGGDTAILGRTLVLDGRRHVVVGVLPQRLNFPPGTPDVFLPLAFSDTEKGARARGSLLAVARLPEGGDVRGANAALETFAARLARQFPETNTARTLFVVPVREMQTGFTLPFVLLFEAGSLFVLLIACANVAGLLVARGALREREMALRAALGAGRGRIVRQLLTEGLVLSLLGAAAALWLAEAGISLIRTSVPSDIVRWVAGWSEIRLDTRTLAFTLALTLATTLACALLPALRSSRADLVETLKAGGHGGSGAPRRRLRSPLVALQVTLALVLLSGAALMTRGFLDLARLYQGFDPERVVTFRLKLPEWQYPERPAITSFYERVVHGVEGAAGIEAAGLASHPPADLGPIPRTGFLVEGRTLTRPEKMPSADFQTISPGYLKALRVAVLRGRALTDADGPEAPPVVLVSQSLAAVFWPGDDPVGRRIRLDGGEAWRTVVGVVADVKQYWHDREPRPTLYVPHLQSPRRDLFLFVRSSLDTRAVVAVARAQVGAADPGQPVDEIRTMATVVSESASIIRLAAALMTILGLVALLLAAVGLHGVISEHAARRTHEIGIRMALGAGGRDVLRLVVGQSARLAAIGFGVGLLGALALGRVMAAMLFGIVRPDPGALAIVTGILAAVVLAAAWIPARRAIRVDPLVALREE